MKSEEKNRNEYSAVMPYMDMTSVNTREDVSPYDHRRTLGRSLDLSNTIKRCTMTVSCMMLLATVTVVARYAVERGSRGITRLTAAAKPGEAVESDTLKVSQDVSGELCDAEAPVCVIGDQTMSPIPKRKHREPGQAVLLGDNPVGDSRTDPPSNIFDSEEGFQWGNWKSYFSHY